MLISQITFKIKLKIIHNREEIAKEVTKLSGKKGWKYDLENKWNNVEDLEFSVSYHWNLINFHLKDFLFYILSCLQFFLKPHGPLILWYLSNILENVSLTEKVDYFNQS